ncbi:uncharacterized protein LOC103507182 isoform X1 [Diaphorina citri]|uniref:Uncharacterized protein LOC103507182 isoform X1 n=1 Tax=Diaphorina citri TaxID=121845 RepID=A0A1S3CXL7_DIACI|nr:uncharacterized protein LOC103507182 isoform X1 [Diaphorina citri]KAI5712568.1 hypothetical protein M8J75_009463 [Diaphorina citri]KAI5750249.1 hypothetical protein M8J76_014077 [Diaphorina citri]KAI5753529.1 hypothetical protein M8J77_001061 [Diaphorina citri]
MTTNKKTDEEEYLSTEEIRSHLRWRVYFFLFVQILVATGVIYSIFHIKTLHTILLNNLDVLYIAELTGILCLFMLSMYEEMRCDTECGSPVNLVTLGIYSVALAIHACGTVHLYTTQQNRMAAFITSAAFLVLSQCAYHTNHDFFVAGGNAVMYTYIFRFASHIFSDYTILVFVFKILNFLITCVDIISDTQSLKFVQCQDYILSCAHLYFDLFHMFSCTLALMPVQEAPGLMHMIKQLVSLDYGIM